MAMIGEIKNYLESTVPASLYNGTKIVYGGIKQAVQPVRTLYYLLKYRSVRARHRKARELVRGKEKIKAAFFLIQEPVWKYEGVYRLMERDERFEPVIIVCPYLLYGEAQMQKDMEKAFSSFSKKGYNVIRTLGEDGSWLDVKNGIRPDLIFFTIPYFYSRPEYHITHFPDTLTFYVPYVYVMTERPGLRYRQELHQLAYKIFHESEYHARQARKHAMNRGYNAVVTGYPGLDFVFRDGTGRVRDEAEGSSVHGGTGSDRDGSGESMVNDPWMRADRRVKRIIWAPHHSIETAKEPFNYSNFLAYHQFFLELAERYADEIILSFKPHPLLKSKLKALPGWGDERTEAYYREWERRPNCQLNEGLYDDLFLTSDAMIHDSVSFLAEYFSTGKPSLYMIADDFILSGFSAPGKEIVHAHYHSHGREDVESFIREVVLGGNDTMKPQREALISTLLRPPNNSSASQHIMNEIARIIEK